MASKSRVADDTSFDRRRPSSNDGARGGVDHERRRSARRDTTKTAALTDVPEPGGERRQERRSTRDGRQPLVIYLRPEVIKALKISALEDDTTASAVVADAVSVWLRSRSRPTRTPSSRTS